MALITDLDDRHERTAPAASVTSRARSAVGWFAVRQVLLVVGAIAAYFGVRGLTEGEVELANRNAARVLDVERFFGLAQEGLVQDLAAWSDLLVNLGNWVYIWAHWPVILATLVWFAWTRRGDYLELRNAIFVSGAIGLVIFAVFPVAPPRLFSAEFVDTVALRSNSYRVLQPPAFTNKYAAVPSFHFGWNMLVGIAWYQAWRGRWWRWAGVVMPVAMAWAVVVTGNHYVIDIAAGGAVALVGLAIARHWRRMRSRPTVGAISSSTSRRTEGARPALHDCATSPETTPAPSRHHVELGPIGNESRAARRHALRSRPSDTGPD